MVPLVFKLSLKCYSISNYMRNIILFLHAYKFVVLLLRVSILLNLMDLKQVPEGKCACWTCPNEDQQLSETEG